MGRRRAGLRGSVPAPAEVGVPFLSPLCLWGLTDALRGPRASLGAWVFTLGLPARHGTPGPRGGAPWGQHTQNPTDEGLHGPRAAAGRWVRHVTPACSGSQGNGPEAPGVPAGDGLQSPGGGWQGDRSETTLAGLAGGGSPGDGSRARGLQEGAPATQQPPVPWALAPTLGGGPGTQALTHPRGPTDGRGRIQRHLRTGAQSRALFQWPPACVSVREHECESVRQYECVACV